MTGFISYNAATGTATARHVTGWGDCPDGLEGSQSFGLDGVSVAANIDDLIGSENYVFNPETGQLTLEPTP